MNPTPRGVDESFQAEATILPRSLVWRCAGLLDYRTVALLSPHVLPGTLRYVQEALLYVQGHSCVCAAWMAVPGVIPPALLTFLTFDL